MKVVLIYTINLIYTLAYSCGSEKQKCIRATSVSESFVNFHVLLCRKAWKFTKIVKTIYVFIPLFNIKVYIFRYKFSLLNYMDYLLFLFLFPQIMEMPDNNKELNGKIDTLEAKFIGEFKSVKLWMKMLVGIALIGITCFSPTAQALLLFYYGYKNIIDISLF